MGRPGIVTTLYNKWKDNSDLIQLNVAGGPTYQTEKPVTLQGSPFPSPSHHEQTRKLYYAADIQTRCEFYRQIEDQFVNCPVMYSACSELTQGAVGDKGFSFSIKSTNPTTRNALVVKKATEVCREVAKLMPPAVMANWAMELGKFANYPVQVVADANGKVVELLGMSPFGFRINSNMQNRFNPGQKDCYVQYDTLNWQKIKGGEFMESQIVWAAWNRTPREVYGFPPALIELEDSQNLTELWREMPDARKALMPRKSIIIKDNNNDGLDVVRLREFKEDRFAARLARGEAVSPYEDDIINGNAQVILQAVQSDYLNKLDDMYGLAERIAIIYGVPLAILFGTEKVPAATLEYLLDILYSHQSYFASVLTYQIVIPVFQRALAFAGIETSELEIEVMWSQRKTPKQMLQQAEAAGRWSKEMAANGKPAISCQSAQLIKCNYLGLDNESEQRQIDAEEEERLQAQMDKMAQQVQMMGGDQGQSLQGNVLAFNPAAKAKKEGDAGARQINGLKQNTPNADPAVQASKGTSPGKGAPK